MSRSRTGGGLSGDRLRRVEEQGQRHRGRRGGKERHLEQALEIDQLVGGIGVDRLHEPGADGVGDQGAEAKDL